MNNITVGQFKNQDMILKVLANLNFLTAYLRYLHSLFLVFIKLINI